MDSQPDSGTSPGRKKQKSVLELLKSVNDFSPEIDGFDNNLESKISEEKNEGENENEILTEFESKKDSIPSQNNGNENGENEEKTNEKNRFSPVTVDVNAELNPDKKDKNVKDRKDVILLSLESTQNRLKSTESNSSDSIDIEEIYSPLKITENNDDNSTKLNIENENENIISEILCNNSNTKKDEKKNDEIKSPKFCVFESLYDDRHKHEEFQIRAKLNNKHKNDITLIPNIGKNTNRPIEKLKKDFYDRLHESGEIIQKNRENYSNQIYQKILGKDKQNLILNSGQKEDLFQR